jgi:Domain of unknown function (DUF1978).
MNQGDNDDQLIEESDDYKEGYSAGYSAAVSLRNKDESDPSSSKQKYWAHDHKPETKYDFGFATGYQMGLLDKNEDILDRPYEKELNTKNFRISNIQYPDINKSKSNTRIMNTVQNQIDIVEELSVALEMFSEELTRAITDYLRKVKSIGDNHNALKEPFEKYMNEQEEIHGLMKSLNQQMRDKNIPALKSLKGQLSQLLRS